MWFFRAYHFRSSRSRLLPATAFLNVNADSETIMLVYRASQREVLYRRPFCGIGHSPLQSRFSFLLFNLATSFSTGDTGTSKALAGTLLAPKRCNPSYKLCNLFISYCIEKTNKTDLQYKLLI